MQYKELLKILVRGIATIDEMFNRIAYNLDFKRHCDELRHLQHKYMISFVVPTKNEAAYIPKLLWSINYLVERCGISAETIVVDYKSIDGTVKLARKMGAKVIESTRPGIGYASYIGVLNAMGDIIIRTDADVIMTPSAIKDVLETFGKDRKKLVATVGHIYLPLEFKTNFIAYLYDYYMRKPYYTTGYFIAFRKDVTDKINFNPNLRYDEDFDFGRQSYEILGIHSLYYNPQPAVLVSSRLIKKKGVLKYFLEYLGVIQTSSRVYSQVAETKNYKRNKGIYESLIVVL
jgi:glycosyltransferase involved in cell wall biosynthesis